MGTMAGEQEAPVRDNEGDEPTPSYPYIHESLQHLAVPIASLTPDPKNARKHDEENQANVRKSLRTFGQRLPIVVQEEGKIVRAGNNRLVQAQALGWTHIAAVVCDESDAEAIAFALVDNRSAEKGATWDAENLAENMRDLNSMLADFELDFELVDLGWSQDEAEALMGEFDVSPTGQLPTLLSPDDATGLSQITFTFNTDDQQPIVRQAVERAQALGHTTDPNGTNPNKNGNALAAICEQWLAANGGDAD